MLAAKDPTPANPGRRESLQSRASNAPHITSGGACTATASGACRVLSVAIKTASSSACSAPRETP